jgi:cobalamin biosynthesis protein CbiG
MIFWSRKQPMSEPDALRTGLTGVSEAAKCLALGEYLVRTHGPGEASRLADLIVGSVQHHSRIPPDGS